MRAAPPCRPMAQPGARLAAAARPAPLLQHPPHQHPPRHCCRVPHEPAMPPLAASRNGAAAESVAPPQPDAASPAAEPLAGGSAASTAPEAAIPQAEPAEDLRAEVSELRAALEAQSALVTAQQQTLSLLQGYVATRAAQSPVLESLRMEDDAARAVLSAAAINDRRLVGLFDARYHSASSGATPTDFRILPRRIILVRHAESEGNVDNRAYTYLPDPRVPLTPRGWQQAMGAGDKIRAAVAGDDGPPRLFFYTSPYLRSKQTYEGLAQAFDPGAIAGAQEEVQLREQDFGNFQDAEGKQREKAERLRFGRFFYRFPNGESGADVYDRMTLFEDHLVRDINAGRFAGGSSLVLVTHGLALRVFLMRWFHWTVDQFMNVYNPPNAEPLVLERVTSPHASRPGGPATWIHTKALYRLSTHSREVLEGCTEEMCETSWAPRGLGGREGGAPPPREVHPLLEEVDGEQPRRGSVGAHH